jgi:cytochrome c
LAWRCHIILFFSVFSVVISLSLAAAQERDEGERAFQKCYSCHSVDRAEQNLSGPNLAGVMGRRAGALPGFAYSSAMKKAGADGLTWGEETLDRYLADPLETIPDTTMSFPGLRSAGERRAVIGYLRRFR